MRYWQVTLLVVSFATGTAIIAYRDRMIADQPPQLVQYNNGLRAYRNGQNELAVELFQRSIDEYKAASRQNTSVFTLAKPQPSRLYAGLAWHGCGKAFIKLGRPLDALNAFIASQQVNPGDWFDEGTSPEEVRQLNLASFDCKRNMERLLQDNPQLAEGLRPGRPGQKGDKPSPNNDPNNGRTPKGRPQDDI